MKTSALLSFLFSIFCCAIISCQKIALQPSNDGTAVFEKNAASFAFPAFQLVSAPFVPVDNDSIERPTTLGVQLTNPYLIPNMQQAYSNLGLSSSLAVVNNWYVRFLPTTSQLAGLDSIMDAQGLDLFDTPMDYDVTYEGDYYQDPSIPDSLPTWQYAVVPAGFVFPSGIQHETLGQINIPGDNYTAVETEAERLARIQDSLNLNAMAMSNGTVHPNVLQCGPGYEWNYQLNKCVPKVPEDCPLGYHWDGNMCIRDAPPPPPIQPPAPDAAIPGGNITVYDTNLGTNVGVRKARMVARRWFKIDRTYTDNNGHFVFAKKFKHKVRVDLKFKNDDAQVRNIRGVRLWQMFFPVKKTFGIYSGDKSNISYTFIQYSDYGAKGNMFWTAATVHNSVQEYRDYATSEHIGLPPQGLKIFVSKTGLAGNGGATPMFGKRATVNLATEYVLYRISNVASIVYNIIAIIKAQMDIVIGYRHETNGHRDITQLKSDRIKETTYHELAHAGHYAALGNSWYATFVNAEIFEIVSNFSSGYSPYGDGSNSQSAIIALGESWAYYMGHFMADKRYPTTSSCQNAQGKTGMTWCNGTTGGTGHPHLDVEENFNPNLSTDPFHWIPQGLFYDLFDPANETLTAGNPVNDLVSGYTNQQMFNAFQSTIYTLQDYKATLFQTTTNPTSAQVTGLFAQYHY